VIPFTKTFPHFLAMKIALKIARNTIVENFHFAFTFSLVRQILLAAQEKFLACPET